LRGSPIVIHKILSKVRGILDSEIFMVAELVLTVTENWEI
jgi:hypothetical protein